MIVFLEGALNRGLVMCMYHGMMKVPRAVEYSLIFYNEPRVISIASVTHMRSKAVDLVTPLFQTIHVHVFGLHQQMY